MDYTKPWLSLDEQIDKLTQRGLFIRDRDAARALLRHVGYYRLTGYLYPFRISQATLDEEGTQHTEIQENYYPGTTLEQAAEIIEFDRKLRLLVLEGVEHIEIALRTQIGYSIGRCGPFAHEDHTTFIPGMTSSDTGSPSSLDHWLARVKQRCEDSKEAFVEHFREKYDGQIPIWALTELLELGLLSKLYAGLRNDLATEIANSFEVPTKRLMRSWIATINYVRNISAHHARLFNRKLVTAPKRPRPSEASLLAHLTESDAPKDFGSYNALAVMAYLYRSGVSRSA